MVSDILIFVRILNKALQINVASHVNKNISLNSKSNVICSVSNGIIDLNKMFSTFSII